MKTHNFLFILLMVFSLQACEEGYNNINTLASTADTIPPVLKINGESNDTAYLYTNYRDKGVVLLDYTFPGGELKCSDDGYVEVAGAINNRLPGTYLLTYTGNDATGNKAAAVTRTIHVVENRAGFLSGRYNVVCSCTAATVGSGSPTVTAESYTAVVAPHADKDNFELIPLNLGPGKVIPFTSLSGNIINAGYFSTDYARGSASGTLSPTKNTFTIESMFYPYSPAISYKCKNVYTKQLTIVKN